MIALSRWRFSVYMDGVYAGLAEAFGNVLRVIDGRCEHDSGPSLGDFLPVRDDVARELRLVHDFGQFTFIIIAAYGMHGLQVRREWGEVAYGDEIAVARHVLDARAAYDGIVNSA